MSSRILILPPRNEQADILKYTEKATDNLSRAVETTRREIDLIREYRTCLIADVVTGKVDVRHLAPETVAPEPEDLAADLDDELTDEAGAEFETESEASDD